MAGKSSKRRARAAPAEEGAEVGRAWPGGPLIVGWTEFAALPDWGIPAVRAKMDTGARTSALHVENVEEVDRHHVRFDVVLDRRRSHRRVHVKARIVRRGRVRSSNGEYSHRLFVSTRMRLGPLEREVEFSLVDRARMIHRVLLGRSALHGIFVDVGHRHLLGRPRRKKKKRAKKRRARSAGEAGSPPRRGGGGS